MSIMHCNCVKIMKKVYVKANKAQMIQLAEKLTGL